MKMIKFDEALRKAGFEGVVKKAGLNLNSGKFIGALLKYFVIVVFLIASFDVLGLNQVTAFLQQVVLGYLPQLIIAILILLVGAVGNCRYIRVCNIVNKSGEGAKGAGDLARAPFRGHDYFLGD